MNNIYEEEAKKRIKNNMKDVLKNIKEYQKNLEKYELTAAKLISMVKENLK